MNRSIYMIKWIVVLELVLSMPLTAQAFRLEGELSFFTRSIDESTSISVSPLVEAEFGVSDDWSMLLDWGFIFTDLTVDDDYGESTFQVGNPFIGANYSLIDTSLNIQIGFGLGLPLASVSEGEPVEALAYSHASNIRGWWDMWLWRTRTLSFVIPFHLSIESLPLVNIRGDAAPALLVVVEEQPGNDTDLVLQLGGEAGIRLGLVELGARLQFVVVPTADDDNAQTAVEPYILADLEAAYLRVGLLMNLDEPLGFAFDRYGYWGLHLNAGIDF